MTNPLGKRRGRGEDSIYFDASRNRYIGAVDLGFSPAGTRIRKKVSGRTKVEVRDKLRELHKELDVDPVKGALSGRVVVASAAPPEPHPMSVPVITCQPGIPSGSPAG